MHVSFLNVPVINKVIMIPNALYMSYPAGPTALVQFNVWECGDVDKQQLKCKLVKAAKHAVCDIILEYRLLTAPLCEVPLHYARGMDSPLHTAPPSPISVPATGKLGLALPRSCLLALRHSNMFGQLYFLSYCTFTCCKGLQVSC